MKLFQVLALFAALAGSAVTLAATPTVKYLGAWSAAVKYKPGQIVLYRGATWISVAASLGNEPSQSPTQWTKVGNTQPVGVRVVDNQGKTVGTYLGKDAQGLGQITLAVDGRIAQVAFDALSFYSSKVLYFAEENCAGRAFDLIFDDESRDKPSRYPLDGLDIPISFQGNTQTAYVPDGYWGEVEEITYRSKSSYVSPGGHPLPLGECVNEMRTLKNGWSSSPISKDPNGCIPGNTCWYSPMNHCMALDLCNSENYEGQCQCYPGSKFSYQFGVRNYKSVGDMSTLYPSPYHLESN